MACSLLDAFLFSVVRCNPTNLCWLRGDTKAAQASSAARQLKIADKIANLRDILADPPVGWPPRRKLDYLDWAERVVHGCRGVNVGLDALWQTTLAAARKQLEAEG